ncbi:class I SAM-dependent methyltransferase [Flavobacterium sp. N502540]|uniref:class I SAM-dependent methyltransferase n=1 Tax=Flavobacterium sp. N502540 TaxID=2986838 RepID=UPI0022250035|nr:class I SAM-dependent methyltransferase [Flavobacterium sp. N502540]
MEKLLVRLINKIKNFNKSKKQVSNAEDRLEKITALRSEKKSDIERWSQNEELYEDWNERTKILGDYIHPNATILEFGAGNMILKTYLKNYSKYTPSDILKRFEETVVCDLNEPISLDLLEYNTIVFSGVLEYVYDIENVFKQIKSNTKQIVLSYCCSDIVKLTREKNGWLSDYTRPELEQIFKKYDFEVESYTEWRQQSIYNLKRII